MAASVGEPFDVARLAHDHPRPRGSRPSLNGAPRLLARLEVATSFNSAPLLTAAGHCVQAYTNDETFLHLGASVSRWLFVYGGSGYSPAVEGSASDGEAAPEAVLELDHALHRLQGGSVLLTAKHCKHARMVVG